MKTKLNVYHEIDNEDKAEEYLNNSISFIGLILMYFKFLESFSVICERFTDRRNLQCNRYKLFLN